MLGPQFIDPLKGWKGESSLPSSRTEPRTCGLEAQIASGFKGIRKFSELEGEKNNCIFKYICFGISQLFTDFHVIRLKKSLNLKFKCKKS